MPAGRTLPLQAPAGRRQRSSLGGGIPAQQRVLGVQGRKTVRRLLEAGLAEFGARGLLAEAITTGMTAARRDAPAGPDALAGPDARRARTPRRARGARTSSPRWPA